MIIKNCQSCIISKLQFSTSQSIELVEPTIEWIIKNQDAKGGWPMNFNLKEKKLRSGWYSSMAQGQIISLLVRYYYLKKDVQYLKSSIKAFNIFNISTVKGGVKAYVFNKYIWLEEYPSIPPTFVLNGFMYSIVGIYDLQQALKYYLVNNDNSFKIITNRINILLNLVGKSLKTLLPLYDTGSGSLYDLTHITQKYPPNRARWDYHVVHINLLQLMSVIFNDSYYFDVSMRWKGYLYGNRTKHN
ncbi:unnamed protein product [Gordionus sp. m RMFG-2023]